MRRALTVPLILLAGCGGDDGRRGVPRGAPPAAAVVMPGMERQELVDQLDELERELARAVAGEADRLLPAEAITDRLIHADRPVDWLATGYDVEARLRQLQAMADRVVALLRRGASLDEVEPDIVSMLEAVADLRRQLAREGGGTAPPTLDSLLAQDPLRDVQSASLRAIVEARDSAASEREELPEIEPRVAPVRSGLLGRPIGADTLPDERRP